MRARHGRHRRHWAGPIASPNAYAVGATERCMWVVARDPTRYVGLSVGPAANHGATIDAFGDGEAVEGLGHDARWCPRPERCRSRSAIGPSRSTSSSTRPWLPASTPWPSHGKRSRPLGGHGARSGAGGTSAPDRLGRGRRERREWHLADRRVGLVHEADEDRTLHEHDLLGPAVGRDRVERLVPDAIDRDRALLVAGREVEARWNPVPGSPADVITSSEPPPAA